MADQLREGALRFPPIVLFLEGEHYWVGDGFHRVLAGRKINLTEILAEVHDGTQRDALLYSISSNSDHGLPRTNADKRKAVTLLLADAEWSRWSDQEVARRCRVSGRFVAKLRSGASSNGSKMRPRKVRRGDKVYEMNVEPIGSTTGPSKQNPDTPIVDSAPAVVTDRAGIPLRPERVPVFAAHTHFVTAEQLQAQLTALVDQIA